MGGFVGLSIAKKALIANQVAMETIGHNIANANTPGYSRQRVELKESLPDSTPWGAKGTGVDIDDIIRIRDSYLDVQLRNESNELGMWDEKEKFLSRVELYFNEPSDTGLANTMERFWNSWQELAYMPEEQTARNSLYQDAVTLVNGITDLYNNLESLRIDADTALKARIEEINSLAEGIASLNSQIRYYEVGDVTANDLRDQRDQKLTELADLIDYDVSEQPDGTVVVSVGGVNLVDKITTEEVSYRYNSDGHLEPYWTYNNGTLDISSGRLYGIIHTRDSLIPQYKTVVDNIAQAIISQVNKLHVNGYGLSAFSSLTSQYSVDDASQVLASEDSGLDFYDEIQDGSFTITVIDSSGDETENTISISASPTSGTTLNSLISTIGSSFSTGIAHIRASVDSAGFLSIESDTGYNFYINNDTSNALMALGLNVFFKGGGADDMDIAGPIDDNVNNIAASQSGEVGDGLVALDIAQLKDSRLMDNNSATITDYYASNLGVLGVAKKEATDMKNSQEILTTHIKNSIEEISGVSIDEEAMDLIKYQHAYAAAAQFLKTIDQMLDELINGIRR